MKSTMPEARVQVKNRSNDQGIDKVNSSAEVSRGAMIAVGIVPVVAGIWAAACFFGGLLASGGPVAMAKSWFAALTGM